MNELPIEYVCVKCKKWEPQNRFLRQKEVPTGVCRGEPIEIEPGFSIFFVTKAKDSCDHFVPILIS